MRGCFLLLALAGLMFGQTANFSGVWKANFQKSNIAGPPPVNYLVILEQKDGKLLETIGAYTPGEERRSMFSYDTTGKPSINSRSGVPIRTEASWDGGALVLHSKISGTHPANITEKYTLSADGKTLTLDLTSPMGGRDLTQTMVLEKQPESAAEPLRKPEQMAGAHFKNVTVMKDVAVSQFLDRMQTISMSLGVECDFCHVQSKFEADDKHPKTTARAMLVMTAGINKQSFEGRNEVSCYTCHQGNQEPRSGPAF